MSNYDRQLVRAKEGFLTYDPDAMAEIFSLKKDSHYLYIPFFGTEHRISLKSGDVEFFENRQWSLADFNAHLSIFDAICRSEKGILGHELATLNHVKGMVHPGVSEDQLYRGYIAYFTGKKELLKKAAESLGAEAFPVGDIAFTIPIFPFLPMTFQYWEEDEEFPCQLRILWNENILQFVTYETMWYIAGAFFKRLTAAMEVLSPSSPS